MSDNIMKKRLLMLIKLLQDHTDEDHPVSTRDIMAYYKENGMSSDRKTLDADIKLLQEQGFDLIKIKSSPNKYYIASREFELPELKRSSTQYSLLDSSRRRRAANFQRNLLASQAKSRQRNLTATQVLTAAPNQQTKNSYTL